MPRVMTLKPRAQATQSRVRTKLARDSRMTGERLQRLRLELWVQNPLCKSCLKLTQYPYGFHIDHIVPLWQGGGENAANRQLLCVNCHDLKTIAEGKERG